MSSYSPTQKAAYKHMRATENHSNELRIQARSLESVIRTLDDLDLSTDEAQGRLDALKEQRAEARTIREEARAAYQETLKEGAYVAPEEDAE